MEYLETFQYPGELLVRGSRQTHIKFIKDAKALQEALFQAFLMSWYAEYQSYSLQDLED